jgi:polyketide cyclase/dehydrase/lipid transport protein
MRVATDGPVTPAEAWRRYQHLDLWSGWAPQIRRVEADGDQLAPGVTGRVVGPGGISVRFAVLTVEPERYRWSWKVWRGPIAVTLEHGIDPNGHGGSRSWIDLHAPVLLRPLMLGYLPPAWYALHRHVTLPEV